MSRNIIDLDKWIEILSDILDGLMSVIAIRDSERILLIFKVIVENGKVTVNSLPTKVIKDLSPKIMSDNEMAKKIYERTGYRTQIAEYGNVMASLKAIDVENLGLFDVVTQVLTSIYAGEFYPESLLNSFLK